MLHVWPGGAKHRTPGGPRSGLKHHWDAPSIAAQVTGLTTVLQEAIDAHVPEKTICWASKPWWSPAVAAARRTMRHLLHRAERHGTTHDWSLYRRARRAFTTTVRRAKASAWRDFCASVNTQDLWSHVRRIVKPHQRLHVEDLRSPQGNGSPRMRKKRRSLLIGFSPLAHSPLPSMPSLRAAGRTSSNGFPRGGMIFLH